MHVLIGKPTPFAPQAAKAPLAPQASFPPDAAKAPLGRLAPLALQASIIPKAPLPVFPGYSYLLDSIQYSPFLPTAPNGSGTKGTSEAGGVRGAWGS